MGLFDNLVGVVVFAGGLVVAAGIEVAGGPRNDCGDYAKDEAVCEQVVARSNEVGTVPEGHEQRERARGD